MLNKERELFKIFGVTLSKVSDFATFGRNTLNKKTQAKES